MLSMNQKQILGIFTNYPCKKILNYYHTLNSDHYEIYIISPCKWKYILHEFPRFNFTADEDLIPNFLIDKLNLLRRSGWYKQQILKIIFLRQFEANQNIAIIDGDTIVSPDLFSDKIFTIVKQEPLSYLEMFEFDPFTHLKGYAEFLFKENISPIVNFSICRVGALDSCFGKTLNETLQTMSLFLDYIARKQKTKNDKPIFSEYILFYCAMHFDNKKSFQIENSKNLKIFRYGIYFDMNAILNKINSKAYDAIAVEFSHKKNILRYLRALLFWTFNKTLA